MLSMHIWGESGLGTRAYALQACPPLVMTVSHTLRCSGPGSIFLYVPFIFLIAAAVIIPSEMAVRARAQHTEYGLLW